MKRAKKKPAAESAGGTYVYDKTLGRIVKVSDRIPRVSSRRAAPRTGPCGRPPCGRGRCGDA